MKHNLLNKALVLWLLLCLLCPAALAEEAAAATEPVQLRELASGLGKLNPINKTAYLLAQEPNGENWGMISTSGKQLIPYHYGSLSYISYDCFLGGLFAPLKSTKNHPAEPTLEYINSKALVAWDGTLVTEHLYGDIKVYNHYWAACWILEEGTEEDNDYKYDKTHFYKIKRCDIYWLGDYCQPGSSKTEKPAWRASLNRSQFKNAQAHDRYLSVQDREDQVTMYNFAFQPVSTPGKIGTAAYRVRNYAVVTPEGSMLMDGYTAVSEANTSQGMLLVATRTDYSGVKWNYLYTLTGNLLLGPTEYAIKSPTQKYALLSKDNLVGLYSLEEARFLVPCEFDKIISNGFGMDDYVMNGFVVVEKDGVRSYYDIAAGAVTETLNSELEKYTAMGSAYSYLDDGERYVLVTADSYTKRLTREQSFTAVRGDGYMIPYKQGKYYGLMNWHGAEILPPQYKNKIVITDDNHVIIHSPKRGYCLYELVAESATGIPEAE